MDDLCTLIDEREAIDPARVEMTSGVGIRLDMTDAVIFPVLIVDVLELVDSDRCETAKPALELEEPVC